MNKSALRSFSAWARRYLISNICDRAQFIGVTKDNVVPMQAKTADSFMVNGVTFEFAPTSRNHFVDYVREIGWENAIEEIAYTWFNRILAIRFMEVNGYLENGTNGDNIYVIGSVDPDRNFPDAVDRATELKYVDKEKVYKYQDAEDNAGLFRYILMSQCAELSKWMPDVFEKVSDYTDLLLPETLLFPDGLIEHLTHDLNAADFDISAEGNGQVEIFGWMYQFYIAEKKDEVFKSKEKINKGTLPAATQLFTPDWIVRYMVENSLGKIWVASHSESNLKEAMKYYLDPDASDEEVIKIHEELKRDYKAASIRDIKFIDPCCGSGHILVYAFDLFYRMYLEEGYTADMIPSIILENNLYGLDVDKRAIQLTSFALTMKARSYNKRLFQDGYHFPNVVDVHESNGITDGDIDTISKLLALSDKEKEVVKECVFRFKNAEYFGSLINNFEYKSSDYATLLSKIQGKEGTIDFPDMVAMLTFNKYYDLICTLLKQAAYMSAQYDCVVTNPPYLNPTACNDELKQYAATFYPDSKSDTFAMFIERCMEYLNAKGFQAMITMHSWMFLASYDALRKKILSSATTISMLHLGARAFEDIGGEIVQTTSFILKKGVRKETKGIYCRLVDGESQTAKENMYLNGDCRYFFKQKEYDDIPNNIFAYWISTSILNSFKADSPIHKIGSPKQGMSTCDVKRFTRLWYEVSIENTNLIDPENISGWVKYNKGGSSRKWYGNREYLVWWHNNGKDLQDNGALLRNRDAYFKPFIAWTKIASGGTTFRWFENNCLFDGAGGSLFITSADISPEYVLGFLNTNICSEILSLISPTLNFNENHIGEIPILFSEKYNERICSIVKHLIEVSRAEWDSYETSWDYSKHPLLVYKKSTIEQSFEVYSAQCEEWYRECTEGEQELNKLFGEIYGTTDLDLTDSNITIRKADREREVKSLISYAIGCIMGRYSLKEDGLIFAGNNWDESRYSDELKPCEFGILPITEEQYFESDLCTRVIDFVRVVYGNDTLQENLKYIAATLKPGSFESPKSILRDYLFNSFFEDHYQMYQRRPIYWQLDSGKAGGFRAIMYAHRYNENSFPLVRTEFIQELRYKYEDEMSRQRERLTGASTTAESNSIKKEITTLDRKMVECIAYDELLNHVTSSIANYSIDLDDGVLVNYSKMLCVDGSKSSNVLTNIKL